MTTLQMNQSQSQNTFEEGDNSGGESPSLFDCQRTIRRRNMFPNECVICGKPCSREHGHHWHLCKKCNEKYWIPAQDNYTFSSFLNHILGNIEYFKADCKENQDKIWKELGLDDPTDD